MAEIPVNASDAVVVVVVVSNGQVNFDFDFRADFVDDLKAVYEKADGTKLEFVGGTDFTATGLGTADGGTITLTSYLTSVAGEQLTIYRDITIKRLTDYSRDLFSVDINAENDRITMILQEMARDIARSFKLGFGASPTPADTVFVSDGLGGAEEGPTVAEIISANGVAGLLNAHIGSRNGHPLSTIALDGFMSAGDKLFVEHVKNYAVRPICIGGGVVDNRAIIQDAIDLAISSGRNCVFLPPGTFALSDSLSVPASNFFFFGSGIGVTNLVMTANEKSGIIVKSGDGSQRFSVSLLDFSLTIATANADAATNCIGVDMERVAGALIRCDVSMFGICYKLAGCFDVKLFGVTSVMGALTPNGRRIVYVTKASAPYGGAYGGNIHMVACDLRTGQGQAGNPGAAKILHIDAVDGLFATGCYFGYASAEGVHIQKVGDFISGVKFTGCWFDTAAGNGVHLDGTGGPANGDCTFVANQFFGGGVTQRNMIVEGDWSDLTISGGNVFASATADNLYLQTTGQNISVVGNKFREADNENAAGGEGIQVQSCTGVLISDNIIQGGGFTDNGILVNDGSDIQIVGNQIRGCVTGIWTSGTLNNYMITGNLLRGNSFMNLRDLASGVNKVVANNLIV